MRELLRENRKARFAAAGMAAVCAVVGALYLYFHDPVRFPIPCIFHLMTGLYCPGCGAGRACYAILHGRFLEAFCYNPVMTVLIPFIGLYFAARIVDWVWTGGNHVDRRINTKLLLAVLWIVVIYGVLRNIPVFPFTLLAPGGLAEIF